MTTEKPAETAASPFDRLFTALLGWRKWNAECRENALEMIALANARPEGATHDPNLFRDDRGRIWRTSSREASTALVELRRSSEPFGAYEPTGTEVIVSRFRENELAMHLDAKRVERSWAHPHADWGWEVKPLSCGCITTLEYYKSHFESADVGLALADKLLGQHSAIETWLKAMGLALDRTDRRSVDLDWDTLVAKFAPEYKDRAVPDNGALLCVLHAAIDELAGCAGIRIYLH